MRTQLAASYFGCRVPRYVRQDMRRMQRQGFSRVIHTFSENDLFYYPGTMKDIVAISQDAGLEVLLDPWGVAGVFGGEAFSHWIIEEPDIVQRGRGGRPLGGICLNHPRLLERMEEWLEAAAATGADGVFWDEPHWVHAGPRNPDNEQCTCTYCRERAGADVGSPTFESMRGRAVVDLLGALARVAGDRGLRSSLCVLPLATMEQPGINWAELAILPGIDEFGTDPYWYAFGKETPAERQAFINDNASAARAAAVKAGIPVMLWVQVFRIRADQEEGQLAGVRQLLAHRPETVALWGFEACAHMSALTCERPRRHWRRLLRLLHAETRPPGARGMAGR